MINHFPDAPALDVLADPTRRAVLMLLATRARPAGELAAAFPISKPALSRHLRLLRSRGLVEEYRVRRDGRVRMYRLRRPPLDDLVRWTRTLQAFWKDQLTAFEEFVRTEAAGRPQKRRRPRPRTPVDRRSPHGRRRYRRPQR